MILYRRFQNTSILEKLTKNLIYSIIFGFFSVLFEDFMYMVLPFIFMAWEIYREKSIKFSKVDINYFLIALILELIISMASQGMCKVIIYIVNIAHFYPKEIDYLKLYLILGPLTNFMIILTISEFTLKFNFRLEELQKKITSFKLDNQIFLMLLSLFISFEVILFMGDLEGVTALITGTLMFSFISFTVLMIWLVYNLIQVWSIRQKITNSKEQNRQFDDYLNSVQQQYADLRKFKHDFKNIVLSMKIGSDGKFNENYEELYSELLNQKEMSTDLDGKILSEYKKISNEPLRGLIIQKFFKSKSNGLKLDVHISSDSVDLQENILDIIRIVGILLDNAIEETIKCNNRNINMAFIKNDNTLEISIENPLEHTIDIRKIFKEGYSTKGSGRGTGLANVSKIVDSKSNLYLDTEIVNNNFRITLIILERG
ncbi:sensor histidine kinase [Companilactobacillus nantensis]|uniref:sensor histidine kinase n=2 Tax=Companilactobacillus nantensis TaxID=305793 RepID=UPI001649D75B|nr:GHKL domain-containing protein [Companilactobacillus nantensis]